MIDRATCGRFIACIVAACVFYYVIGPLEEETRPVNRIAFMLGSKIIDPEEASTLIPDSIQIGYNDGSTTVLIYFKESPHDDAKTPELNDLALPDTTLPVTDGHLMFSSSSARLPPELRRRQ